MTDHSRVDVQIAWDSKTKTLRFSSTKVLAVSMKMMIHGEGKTLLRRSTLVDGCPTSRLDGSQTIWASYRMGTLLTMPREVAKQEIHSLRRRISASFVSCWLLQPTELGLALNEIHVRRVNEPPLTSEPRLQIPALQLGKGSYFSILPLCQRMRRLILGTWELDLTCLPIQGTSV